MSLRAGVSLIGIVFPPNFRVHGNQRRMRVVLTGSVLRCPSIVQRLPGAPMLAVN